MSIELTMKVRALEARADAQDAEIRKLKALVLQALDNKPTAEPSSLFTRRRKTTPKKVAEQA